MAEARRVLVIEGEAGIREVLAAVLADEDYDVRSDGNGRDAPDVMERLIKGDAAAECALGDDLHA
jgi:DNA-binding NtrC family response regulator